MHVGVGADARIPEQIPGPTDGVACLEDRVLGPGALGLQVVAGTDAGQPSPDHQDIEVRRAR